MLDSACKLSGTGAVGAAGSRALVFIVENRLAASRTTVGHVEHLLCAVSLFRVGANDFGDNISRLLNRHRIADKNVLFTNKFKVVQGGSGNGRSRKMHRLKHRRRG